jgi:hypothetical protein
MLTDFSRPAIFRLAFARLAALASAHQTKFVINMNLQYFVLR